MSNTQPLCTAYITTKLLKISCFMLSALFMLSCQDPASQSAQGTGEVVKSEEVVKFGTTRQAAGQMNLDTIVNGNLSKSVQSNYFKIEVSSIGNLTIETSGELDTKGSLLDENGNEIVSATTGASEGKGNFMLEFKVSAGTYYIRVERENTSQSGEYTLSVFFRDDDHGNNIESATEISIQKNDLQSGDTFISKSISAGLEYEGDVDFFKIVTDATGYAKIYTKSDYINSLGELYDKDGNKLAYDEDSGPGNNFEIVYFLVAENTYISVKDELTTIGPYSLYIEFTPDDAGDNADDAKEVELANGIGSSYDTIIDASFENSSDIDFFKFTIPERGRVQIETLDSLYTIGTLYDVSGTNQIDENYNNGTRNNFKIVRILDPDDYVIKVIPDISRETNFTGGKYRFHISHILDTDDEVVQNAKELLLDSSTNYHARNDATILPAGDIDFYKFQNSITGADYIIKTLGTLDTHAYVYNSSQQEIASDDNSGDDNNAMVQIDNLAIGTYYIKIIENDNSQEGEYGLELSLIDDFSNQKETASEIQINTQTAAALDYEGDEDMFKVELSADGQLGIETMGSTDTEGFLYDATGNELVNDNDSGVNTNTKIAKSLDAGVYYIKIAGNSNTASGSYTLEVSFFADDYKNEIQYATEMSLNASHTGVLEYAGDIDYFKIVSLNQGLLVVETTEATDTLALLYDSSGKEILRDDNSGNGNNAKIEKSVGADTFYLAIKGATNNELGAYAFSITLITDDHANDADTSTLITIGATQTAQLDYVGDIDYFKIESPNQGLLVVETTGATDTLALLYDVSGNEITRDDNSGNGSNAKIEKSVGANSYYLAIMGAMNNELGSYTFSVSLLSDDHGNDPTQASVISVGLSVAQSNSNFEYGGDVDYFKFDFDGGLLEIKTTGNLDTIAYLYDDTSKEIVRDDNSGDGDNLKIKYFLSAGTYLIKIQEQDTTATGSYALSYSNLFRETTALTGSLTELALNSNAQSDLSMAGEVDYYEIQVSSVGELEVNTTGTLDTQGVIFNTGYTLKEDDNSGIGNNFMIATPISATASGPKTIYVRVKGKDASQVGNYTFNVIFRNDDYPNSSSLQQTSIAYNSSTQGYIMLGFNRSNPDSDTFKIAPLPSKGRLQVELISSANIRVDVGVLAMEFYPIDTNHREVANNYDVPNTDIHIRFDDAQKDEEYVIIVRGENENTRGDYTVNVSFTEDDHGNSITSATVLSSTSTTASKINYGGDSDYFKLELSTGGQLIAKSTSSLDTVGTLYDASEIELNTDDNSGDNDNFKIDTRLAEGVYYLRIKGQDDSVTGDYTLDLTLP